MLVAGHDRDAGRLRHRRGPALHDRRASASRATRQLTDDQLRSRLKLHGGPAVRQRRAPARRARDRPGVQPVRVTSTSRGSQDPDYLRIDARAAVPPRAGQGRARLHDPRGQAVPRRADHRQGQLQVAGQARPPRDARSPRASCYNAGEVQDATDRIRSTALLRRTWRSRPIGDDPDVPRPARRGTEARTAPVQHRRRREQQRRRRREHHLQQRNFDIANWPDSWGDIFTDRAFTGAGQDFRISLEPGTEQTNASVRFTEPYALRPALQLHRRGLPAATASREDYDDTRARRARHLRQAVQLRLVGQPDPPRRRRGDRRHRGRRASARRRSSTPRATARSPASASQSAATRPTRASSPTAGTVADRPASEFYGALGGDYHFQKFTLGYDALPHAARRPARPQDGPRRCTATPGTSPATRCSSSGSTAAASAASAASSSAASAPARASRKTPSAAILAHRHASRSASPLVGETLRGVVFTDVGTVEEEFEIGTIRSSVGAGVRLVLPFLGPGPARRRLRRRRSRKDDEDDTQIISFSFGFTQ